MICPRCRVDNPKNAVVESRQIAGQVTHDDGLWEIDADFPGLDVIRAAELLRERGWRVDAPARSTRP